MTAAIGPFRADRLRAELEQRENGVGLRRVLETVVDSFGALERSDGVWIELQKRVERLETSQ